jgi:hypothetical protein
MTMSHRSFNCTKHFAKCANQVRCIGIYALCDGHEHCSDGSDETVLELSHGVVNNCSLQGSPCLSLSKEWWNDIPRPGARCGNKTGCIEASKFCDGTCNCPDDGCFDEDPHFCIGWKCTVGFFKCHTTGHCLPMNKVSRCEICTFSRLIWT